MNLRCKREEPLLSQVQILLTLQLLQLLLLFSVFQVELPLPKLLHTSDRLRKMLLGLSMLRRS